MLDHIIANKRKELARQEDTVPLDVVRRRAEAAQPPRDFAAAVKRENSLRLLAEIKRASPSRGMIRKDFSPADIARTYAEAGAHALSVLTERKYFRGADRHLTQARAAISLPVLRKDFTLSEYHVYQARAANADAVLLMTQVLSPRRLLELFDLTEALGMTAFVEGHDPNEISEAVDSGARVIGINNRDLVSLEVDLSTTEQLREMIPHDRIVVSQSGMETPEDVRRMADAGVDAVQIGSSLMASDDLGAKLHQLLGA